MSTRSSLFYAEIHLYHEMHDNEIHLELDGDEQYNLVLKLPRDFKLPPNFEWKLFNYLISQLK